jgi:hypothetical protein
MTRKISTHISKVKRAIVAYVLRVGLLVICWTLSFRPATIAASVVSGDL